MKTFLRWPNFFSTLAHLYLLLLAGWFLARTVWGDGHPVLFMTNAMALYLLLPVIGVAGLAVWARRWELGVGAGLGLLLALFFTSAAWLPRLPPAHATGPNTQVVGPTLKVMTYNLQGNAAAPAQVLAAIRAANVDVVAFQELHPETAALLQTTATTEYPYQILDAQPGVFGMGVISRYPLTDTGVRFAGVWVGTPQVLTLTWEGQAMHLLNVHPTASNHGSAQREDNSRAVLAFQQQHPAPLLLLGDLNATERNTSYAMLTTALTDSWREAGQGLGHTFPSGNMQGRPFPIPWLIRIDYVLHSAEFIALTATTGPWDGGSDHRPVVVELAWAVQ